MPTKHSIVEYYGERGYTRCGYCKTEHSKVNHGMWTHSLACQDYEDLLNRGWRRSGKYCYKPIMNRTCCPQYTIRCDVNNIKLSKSQKKVIKRFNTYIKTGKKPTYFKNDDIDISFDKSTDSSSKDKIAAGNECQSMDESRESITSKSHEKSKVTASQNQKDSSVKQKQLTKGPDPNKPPCRKAKEIRRDRKIEKLKKSGIDSGKSDSSSTSIKTTTNQKTIEDFICDIPENSKHKFEMKLIAVNDKKDFTDYFPQAYALFCKYQTAIHHDLPEKLNENRVKLVRCCSDSKDFQTFYQNECLLFKKYQMSIHKEPEEDSDERQFRRFLVDTPLKSVLKDGKNDVPLNGLGTFHQQYFIDGKLVAVGVLDILPHCVSSKYLFYDPDYSFLSLGTYTALREIYFVRSLHSECAQMKYYYMGFYLHNCQKMKYKGQYHPSYLLCPESYSYQPINNCVAKLDVNKYSRLNEDADAEPDLPDISKTLILYNSRIMSFNVYLNKLEADEVEEQIQQVTEYSNLAGKSASKILLFRS